jgi:formylglycine-generating enzyme required for sulfatase activity
MDRSSSLGWLRFCAMKILWVKELPALSLLCALWCSCVHINRPPAQTSDSGHQGMRKIASSGKSFLMGTNDSMANIDEKPAMPVTFTYDYWIDTTDVTQAEYVSFVGTNPVSDTSAYGKGQTYPVYLYTRS